MYAPATTASTVRSTSPNWSGYISGRLGAIVRRLRRRHIGQTVRVSDAFPIVIIGVSVIAAVVAVVASLSSGGLYDRIGAGGFSLDRDESEPAPGSPQARAEADEEIRQLVEAKSARRVARGQPALDVDAEVQALMSGSGTGADAALREEVRQLVIARNERRIARGEEPLDVESEIERQLRDAGA